MSVEGHNELASGYAVTDQVLCASECDRLTQDLCDRAIKRSRAGARHLMTHPAVAALASDTRLLTLAREALGHGAVPYRATLFEKSGTANWLVIWHQDTALPLAARFADAEWGPWSEKSGITYAHAPGWALERVLALRIHLNALTHDNGPLRVLPGTHAKGLLKDEDVFEMGATQQYDECHVGRGGVLAMRPLLVHSSPKALTSDPRRVIHIEYADSLDLAPGIRLAVA
jgi:ectoine hydroxylase-related dioxygenase (phytanoyl-CoA dioxygenase family)